jgi:peptide/nickel transport system permease protein
MVPLLDRPRIKLIILLIRRLGVGLLTAFAALTLTFFILRMIGTDPVDSLLAQGLASVEQAESIRQRLGLDQPLIKQYGVYLSGLVKGDFGISLYTQRPVLLTILEQFHWTIELALTGLLLGVFLGLLVGTIAAWWEHQLLGKFAAASASILTAMPVAFMGVLALWIAVKLGIQGSPLLLPGLVLGLTTCGPIARLIYAHLLESLQGPYILAARARGIRRGGRLLWHALRPTLPPLLSLIALEAAFLFAGTVVTETVFSRPGLGRLMVRAILDGDYPISQALVALAALFYTASHVVADWLALIFDPRLRDVS